MDLAAQLKDKILCPATVGASLVSLPEKQRFFQDSLLHLYLHGVCTVEALSSGGKAPGVFHEVLPSAYQFQKRGLDLERMTRLRNCFLYDLRRTSTLSFTTVEYARELPSLFFSLSSFYKDQATKLESEHQKAVQEEAEWTKKTQDALRRKDVVVLGKLFPEILASLDRIDVKDDTPSFYFKAVCSTEKPSSFSVKRGEKILKEALEASRSITFRPFMSRSDDWPRVFFQKSFFEEEAATANSLKDAYVDALQTLAAVPRIKTERLLKPSP